MYEVEVKVRAAHDPVESALRDAGAEPLGTVEQTDTYYDAPHREFAETDEALRLRRERGDREADVLTYKGPLVERASKTREEHETPVGDREAAAAVLEALGFAPAATVEKTRTRYRLDGYTVTLDDVAGLGEFVEVETEADAADVEAARDGARDRLRDLGLDPSEQIRTSYLGLLLDADGEEEADGAHGAGEKRDATESRSVDGERDANLEGGDADEDDPDAGDGDGPERSDCE